MKINIELQTDLPTMSWLLIKEGSSIQAWCGDGVYICENGLYEGGWSQHSDWQPWRDQTIYLGSGFYVENESLTIVCPSHTCEAVYVLQMQDQTLASNSLAFLMEASNSKIPLTDYSRRLWSLTKGLTDYARVLYSSRDLKLFRYLHARIDVEPDGTITEAYPSTPKQFHNFSEYKNFLLSVISDTQLTSKFNRLACYLSKGYDSVACAALVKNLGGGSAISITKSRYGVDDSGADIAKALGLDLTLVERKERSTYKGGVESRNTYEVFTEEDMVSRHEFFTGLNMADECLFVEDRLLKGSLVLTGFHGDKVWDINQPSNDVMARGDSTGSSMYEFRLRVGFVHVPVPMLGSLAHTSIRDIGLSDDMSDWRLGNSYDRPIARRLAEEAGVPRKSFGQRKQAAATMVDLKPEERLRMFESLSARYATSGVRPQS